MQTIIFVKTECGNESVVGMVEHVQKTGVQRQSGTEYRCDHYFVIVLSLIHIWCILDGW